MTGQECHNGWTAGEFSATGPVRAGGGIQAGFREAQAIDWLIPQDVRIDNFVYVIGGNSAVPNGFRINDYSWTMLTLVETASLIGPNLAL